MNFKSLFDENNHVDGRKLHEFIGGKAHFNRWARKGIDNCTLKEGKDFWTSVSKSTGGRPRNNYKFTLQAAKEMCIVSGTETAKKIREYLINLDESRQSKELLTHDEVVMLSRLKAFFRYVENQKQIYHHHKDHFAANYRGNNNPYAEYNVWRNAMLDIDRHELDRQIKQYCAENSRKLPKIKTNSEKIRFLNEYDALKHAVWDFLKIQGKVDAEKLSNLVRRMAEAENLRVYNKNEDNLFQNKEDIKLTP